MLYSRGHDDVAHFRGWYRQLLWADATTIGGTKLALMAVLKSPARTARDSYEAVRRFGGDVAARHGISRRRQFAMLWWQSLWHGMNADSFYRYQLFLESRRKRASRYLQSPEVARFYRLLAAHGFADAAEMLEDKRAFAAWCAAHGLPSPPVLAAFEGGCVMRAPAVDALPPADLFSKASSGYGGHGTRRWEYAGNGAYDSDSRRWRASELLAELAENSRAGPLVLQPCLKNHPALAGLSSGALTTVRMVTCRRPGRQPRLTVAVYRMAVGAVVADNYTQGGIVSAVDLETGALGPAVRTDDDLRFLTFPKHPGTGHDIVGFRLPHWPQAVELVERAHGLLGDIPFVGWDVGLEECGPVLVEGNWNPGVKLTQMPSGVPLGETDYVRCFTEHLAPIFRSTPLSTLRAYSLWEPSGSGGERSE